MSKHHDEGSEDARDAASEFDADATPDTGDLADHTHSEPADSDLDSSDLDSSDGTDDDGTNDDGTNDDINTDLDDDQDDDAAKDPALVGAGVAAAGSARAAARRSAVVKAGISERKGRATAARDIHDGDGNFFTRIGRWLRQVIDELRKVIWPSRKQMITYAIVVTVFVVVMVALIGGLDWAFAQGVLQVFG